MITITEPKPFEEIEGYLKRCNGVYLIGCGTCATMLHTGGKSEVTAMKEKLEADGKEVTGWMVIPTGCDPLAKEALAENREAIDASDCILVMSCAFGVQTVRLYSDKPVYPALNTMFIGKEESPGYFAEVCMQCGSCVLGRTAAICPLVRCAKLLLNGPCGGSVGGRCEVDADTPCGWQQIIDRLTALGQLDQMAEIEPIKDWSTSVSGGPRQIKVEI
ncbi:MAG: methylenetetrahydrofolate reductase C-terminal domain-containing protein [Dehalococcoidales bacterium]|nr:methylenetetrahydrofolate reductase C-terminal domain-containing protein [Dehalococcoidales bacterium]